MEGRKATFVELVTLMVALIKDRDHDNLTAEERTQKRTRVYQLADEIGAWFEEER